MLNLGYLPRAPRMCGYSLVNWEEDIIDVIVEACEKEEDQLGYRVVFYSDCSDMGDDMVISYVIGASLLENRLEKLNRAGFDAPMTEKAIKIVEGSNCSVAARFGTH